MTRHKAAVPLTGNTLVKMRSRRRAWQYALAPGMRVASGIHRGTPTVIGYLLWPVIEAFYEVRRER